MNAATDDMPSPSHHHRNATVSAVADDDEIDLREVFDLIKSGRWLILSCVVVALLLGAFYVVFARPTYQVNGLVQVDQQTGSGAMSQALGGLASMLAGGGSLVTDAEIQIIQSRLVLNPAIDKLNLLVHAAPHYFPIIGYRIAQWNSAGGGTATTPQPSGAPPFLGRYAWGG
ncbi:MAG TPA: Wzz/FepE/Etk N-terminal domain-containing protein, partial [Nevskiaceae bacterium]|nr:Wzz/FepE/Etk N-terminal domain-containing protein [Nevskiaceae bacterium]